MGNLPLLPLADGGAILGVIMIIATAISVIVSNAKEAKKKKLIRTGQRTDIDKKIESRLAQRRRQAGEDQDDEDVLELDAQSALPPELADLLLTPQDRAAIAAAQRAEAAEQKAIQEQRRLQVVEARNQREQQSPSRPRQQATKQQKPAKPAIMPAVSSGVPSALRRDVETTRGDRLRHLLRKPDSFRTILIASEVLGKPVGLRDDV